MNFRSLPLPEALQRAISDLNFETPTPIQARSLPILLEGRDLVGRAATGTGKTAAFALPMITRLLEDPTAKALVLVPTRELAAQVLEVVDSLTKYVPEMRTSLLIGGTSMMPQLRTLSRKPRIIVATPGRLLDHLRQKSTEIKSVRYLVLDEADRMLDMGFAPQLKDVLSFLSDKRQTSLFSATLPLNILELAKKFLHNPARVEIETPKENKARIRHETFASSGNTKASDLIELLKTREDGSIIIFTRTQSRTDRLAKVLDRAGIAVERIHGGRSQGQRKRALEAFKTERSRILVATDIAARGIDIDHVAHVINFDLPMQPEDFVHRLGRTGRAGREGSALSLISPEERNDWRDIEKLLARTNASHIQTTRSTQVIERPELPPGQAPSMGGGGGGGFRGGRRPGHGPSPRNGGGPAGPGRGVHAPRAHHGGHAPDQGGRRFQRSEGRPSEGGGPRGNGPRDARGSNPQGPRDHGHGPRSGGPRKGPRYRD